MGKVVENAHVISFINMKGGVGKTTLCINIANELAKKFNVLVIDMDPQFNATQSLLLYKARQSFSEGEENAGEKKQVAVQTTSGEAEDIESLIKEEIKSSETYKKISDAKLTGLQIFESANVVQGHHNPSLVLEIKDNLSIIPGDLKLTKKVSGDTSGLVGSVLKHIEKHNLKKDFDFILIDCPPTWSILTHSSLFASDYYIVPSKVDLYSSLGIQLLEEQINEKLLDDQVYALTKRKLTRLGVIFSLVHKIKTEEDRMDFLKGEFEHIDFFESKLPHLPSVPTRFVLFADGDQNQNYSELTNSLQKITKEIELKVKVKEVTVSVGS
ncbi:AAA family ATPase [Bacillus tropicus]|uniref:ParA family protein n=1 Tax=Bacillus tropicus TaxID=2026188 RepID=UPI00114541C1|nr:AAA family ATPase [Bacillus tropicus]MDF9557749.1 AAA family ATPase [Bacillus tropicus]MDF9592363.1 AAA family ATPase [Bacillus tropicus]MDF9650269.1 AAA family ATPase [Bacillus tropicus]